MIRFEPAEARHVPLIARSMRPRDVEEISAGWADTPEHAMRRALDMSYYARVCFVGLEPLAMYGLTPLCVLARTAQVWIFGTRFIDQHKLAFLRASRTGLYGLYQHAAVLTNLIDANDAPAKRWMEWLGGSYVLQPLDRGGRLFQQFVMARPACQQQ